MIVGFEWDEEKNRVNIEKHGIDFRDAVQIFERPTLDKPDTRRNYNEVRVNSLGEVNGQVILNVTHTGRNGIIRLISARLAKHAERNAYDEFRRSLEQDATRPG